MVKHMMNHVAQKKRSLLIALAVGTLLLALVACAPQSGSAGDAGGAGAAGGTGTGDPGGSHATEAAVPGSLMAVHAEGIIDPAASYVKKDCLSCHPRETIVAATADYGGEKDVNPHAAHTEAYECVVCHSVAGESSLKCNGCHDWQLPEGWTSPPKESGSQSARRSS